MNAKRSVVVTRMFIQSVSQRPGFARTHRKTGTQSLFEKWARPFRNVACGSSGRRVADRGARVARATHFQNRPSTFSSKRTNLTKMNRDEPHSTHRAVDLSCHGWPTWYVSKP